METNDKTKNTNTKQYCKFNQTISDDNNILIWEENQEYLVTFESDDTYYFGNPLTSGISKDDENKLYEIIEREEWN